MSIEVEIRGLREAEKKNEQVIADLRGRPFLQGMQDAALIVSNTAKRLAPVDQGTLKASITPTVRTMNNEVLGVVGSNKKQALYMEVGTKPHWPPIAALEGWARRHGVSAYVVARAIARRGLKARKYLENAFKQNETRVRGIIERTVRKIVDK